MEQYPAPRMVGRRGKMNVMME